MYKKKTPHIRYDANKGLLYKTVGRSTSIFWTPNMISILVKQYPCTTNEEIAGILGISPRTVVRKARELGLEKDHEWLIGIWNERRMIAHVESKRKGYPGTFKKGCTVGAAYWFKKKDVSSQETNMFNS